MTCSNVSQIVTRKSFKITRNLSQITRKHIRKVGPVMPPIPFIWGSRVSPKIWGLLLLPKLRVVSVVSWSSCKSATHPPANPFLGRREYQQVSTEITQADTKLNFEVCLLFSWLTSLKTEDCTQNYSYSSGLSRWLFPKISVSYVNR
ncbi:TPA: hypothetical protein HNO39_13850 [Escherichia coli]|nr:hypothetical protein [Escherichia coli]